MFGAGRSGRPDKANYSRIGTSVSNEGYPKVRNHGEGPY